MTSCLVDIVGSNPALRIVLEEWGLDYCRWGEQTLAGACQAAGLDLQAVEAALDRARQVSAGELRDRGAAELVAYVRDAHHAYVRQQLPGLLATMGRVVQLYGAQRQELPHIARVLQCLAADLNDHVVKEEMFAFPWLLDPKGKQPDEWILASLAEDRRRASFRLNCLRFLTNHYTQPEQTGDSYRELYAGLHALEKDLRQHVYIEDRLLFGRAAA